MRSRSWEPALWTALLIALFGGVLRALEGPQWSTEALWLAGEPLLPSADVYAWLAGATGDGRMAGWSMSRLVGWLGLLSGQPYGVVAFWLPCLLAAIPGVMVAWLCWQRGYLLAGVAGGFFAAGSLGYLARTRLGYGDTDLFALAAATGFAIVWALAMEALLRSRAGSGVPARAEFGWLVGGLAVAWSGLVLYPSAYPVLLAVAVAGIVYLVLAAGRQGVAEALVAGIGVLWVLHFGLTGLLLSAALAWLVVQWPQFRTAVGLALVGAVTMVVIGLFQTDLLAGVVHRVGAYLGGGIAPAAISDWQLPGVDDSIQETVRPPWGEWVQRVATHWLFMLGGLAGFAFALLRWPALITFLPLLGLGLASYLLGNRFAMYAAPALGLGLGLGLALLLERVKLTPGRGAAAHFVLAALIAGMIGWEALKPEPAPMLVKDHARVLSDLAELEYDRGRVWTWWDAGYSAQYYSRLPTLADGGNASRQRIFMLGQVLGASKSKKAAGLMRFAASERAQAMAASDDWRAASYATRPLASRTEQSAEAVQSFLDGIVEVEDAHSGPLPDEFLVVSWRTLTQGQWIDYYGRWRLTQGEQGYGQIARIQPPVELDEAHGLLHTSNGVVPLRSLDILDAGSHYRNQWPGNDGAHAVINNSNGEGVLMDSSLYQMMAVQMLIADPKRFEPHFELVSDGFPAARVYRLR